MTGASRNNCSDKFLGTGRSDIQYKFGPLKMPLRKTRFSTFRASCKHSNPSMIKGCVINRRNTIPHSSYSASLSSSFLLLANVFLSRRHLQHPPRGFLSLLVYNFDSWLFYRAWAVIRIFSGCAEQNRALQPVPHWFAEESLSLKTQLSVYP